MKERGHVPLQHRGLRNDPEDNEFVDAGSIRPDQRARMKGSVIVGHHTRESFMAAVCSPRPGDAESPPIPEGYSAAEAREGLRRIWGKPRPPQPERRRDETRSRMSRRREYPQLATDADVRACTRTGGEQ